MMQHVSNVKTLFLYSSFPIQLHPIPCSFDNLSASVCFYVPIISDCFFFRCQLSLKWQSDEAMLHIWWVCLNIKHVYKFKVGPMWLVWSHLFSSFSCHLFPFEALTCLWPAFDLSLACLWLEKMKLLACSFSKQFQIKEDKLIATKSFSFILTLF